MAALGTVPGSLNLSWPLLLFLLVDGAAWEGGVTSVPKGSAQSRGGAAKGQGSGTERPPKGQERFYMTSYELECSHGFFQSLLFLQDPMTQVCPRVWDGTQYPSHPL